MSSFIFTNKRESNLRLIILPATLGGGGGGDETLKTKGPPRNLVHRVAAAAAAAGRGLKIPSEPNEFLSDLMCVCAHGHSRDGEGGDSGTVKSILSVTDRPESSSLSSRPDLDRGDPFVFNTVRPLRRHPQPLLTLPSRSFPAASLRRHKFRTNIRFS